MTHKAQPGGPATVITLSQTHDAPSKWDDKFDRIVKYYRCRRPESDPKKVKLSADLQLQLDRWIFIHGLLGSGRYPKTTQQLTAIERGIPGISARTARHYLEDTRRFFANQDEPNIAYERVMIIEELRDNMRICKKKGDMRSLAPLLKLYIEAIGANKPENVVENRTIINIINYNPEQLGGQTLSDEAIKKMVGKMLGEDKKKQEELFDDFQDVSATKTPA